MTSAAVGMPCPNCKVGLVMSERQGIEIDYCPSCRGIWLDRGELDKIIERSAAEVARIQPQQVTTPFAQPERDSHQPKHPDRPYQSDHRGGYQKRKKSIWEELFD
ncbi:hypothetical protein G3A39_43500 [Paraburkholderia aspalathi]|nr:hypothetical protein [Paraburkholderia aspalathi]